MNKIGILCAGDDELAPFLPEIEGCETVRKAMLTFYCGKIAGMEAVALYSGVCKVNAAVAAQLLIDHFGVEAILNAGTAGALDPSLRVFDTVVSTESAYHDVAADILTEFHPWLPDVWFRADEKLLAAARRAAQGREDVRFGRMVSGEQFINGEQREQIRAAFRPLTVDMETAAAAHVCHVNSIPFLAVRSVTDNADHDGAENFEANCIRAAQLSRDLVLGILAQLGEDGPA